MRDRNASESKNARQGIKTSCVFDFGDSFRDSSESKNARQGIKTSSKGTTKQAISPSESKNARQGIKTAPLVEWLRRRGIVRIKKCPSGH